MDIMGITSFGVDPSHIRSVDEGGKGNTFLDCFDRILSPPTSLGRALMFAHGYVPTRWFPCEANREFNSACEWMRKELGKMVANRRRAISAGIPSGGYDSREFDAVYYVIISLFTHHLCCRKFQRPPVVHAREESFRRLCGRHDR